MEVDREVKKIGKTGYHNLLFFLNAATILRIMNPEKSFYSSFCPIWELLCLLGTEKTC